MYVQRWHGWCHMKLLPFRRVLCTPYKHAPCHFMQSHIRKVHACLAVTCHLHFWQTDRALLRATAVTRGGTDTEIRVGTESRPWRRKFSHRSCRDSNPRPFHHESGASTNELSTLPNIYILQQIHRFRKFIKLLTIPVNSRNYFFTSGFHEFPKYSRDFVQFIV